MRERKKLYTTSVGELVGELEWLSHVESHQELFTAWHDSFTAFILIRRIPPKRDLNETKADTTCMY